MSERDEPASTAWMDDAQCREEAIATKKFFPAKGENVQAVVEVCLRCSVRLDCLTYSMAGGEKFGVWGGVREKGRRDLRREINKARKLNPDLTLDEFLVRQPEPRPIGLKVKSAETILAEKAMERQAARTRK